MMQLIIHLWLGLLLSGPSLLCSTEPQSKEQVYKELAFNPSELNAPPKELCRLRGSVFVTDEPKRAHYFVYVEDYESAAHLNVFVEDNKAFADMPGHWFYTDIQAFADFVVYFTDNKGMADFTIYYTDVSSFAGCRK